MNSVPSKDGERVRAFVRRVRASSNDSNKSNRAPLYDQLDSMYSSFNIMDHRVVVSEVYNFIEKTFDREDYYLFLSTVFFTHDVDCVSCLLSIEDGY